jgi:hypothetical protein
MMPEAMTTGTMMPEAMTTVTSHGDSDHDAGGDEENISRLRMSAGAGPSQQPSKSAHAVRSDLTWPLSVHTPGPRESERARARLTPSERTRVPGPFSADLPVAAP